MNHNELYSLLIRYVDGETSDSESEVMAALIQSDAYWKKEFELINALNQEITQNLNGGINPNTEAKWAELEKSIRSTALKPRFSFSRITKYAVAASIVAVAAWAIFSLNANKNEFANFTPGQTFETGKNEVKNVRLSDGTLVILNQNSKLEIDANYNTDNRYVVASGEIYYDVNKNPKLPFVVKTHNTYTKVFGTSFEIESRTDQVLNIELYSGKISFTSKDKTVLLTGGQQLKYRADNSKIITLNNPTLVKEAWTNQLNFKDTELKTILNELQNHFKITINCPSEIQADMYTANFDGLDLSASLLVLQEITSCKISKEGNNYTLIPN